ncbi:amidase [Azoarcus sp. TTM-91]|uniref:amidase n=1 Tax=Azoarcus sp. TTM-91 TaxID=2691581 RepID=UPI00169259D4|nr:amidase [Azoarcus sp. TTM-91]NMG32884.1 amidase [Azoarcus sp. TTM-91]
MLPTIELLAAELAAGRRSAVELTTAALGRATDLAGEGARVFTRIDAERAMAAASASDTLRAAGIVRSPLEGLPVSVKDLFDIAGQPTTAGSVLLKNAPPATRNAVVIDRLIAAGAIIVGRTNMTEFAYSGLGLNPHYGTPRNPWDRATGRIPGGSSSGAAVSVSDGMAVAAVGSDTGGSVRIPSALCGLTGFKPTARRVSMEGVLPLSTALDSIGPLAASVRCCAIMDAVLAGEPVDIPAAAELADASFAVPTDVALNDMDETVATAFEIALARLQAEGARVRRIALPEFSQLAQLHARGTFTAAEAWAWHRGYLENRGAEYDPRVGSRIAVGAKMSAADLLDLIAARRRWIAAVEARIAGFDALLMPTVPRIAPEIDLLVRDEQAYFAANGLMLRNPTLINFLDGCALSVPCHDTGNAPVGLMIAAAGGSDRRVLALGQAIESVLAA